MLSVENEGGEAFEVGETIKVFVSSTFEDMKAERDYLVTVVWPELKGRLEEVGLEFRDVDLRWGVPGKKTDDEPFNSWEYCQRSIDGTWPFFIALLGSRYGHIPDPEEIKDPRERERWAGRSITEMEIRHAVLDRETPEHAAFFYQRSLPVPDDVHEDTRKLYVDRDHEADVRRLQQEIAAAGWPIRRYPCVWKKTRFGDLDEFGELVLADLWSWIERNPDRLPRAAWTEATDPVEIESIRMRQFARRRISWLEGRQERLSELEHFARDGHGVGIGLEDDGGPNRVYAVVGPPGRGKTTVLAKLALRLEAEDDILAISHFVGATVDSTRPVDLLRRFCRILARHQIGGPREQEADHIESAARTDLESLKTDLAQRLSRHNAGPRVVLLIDAVNQLATGHDLSWLPPVLGDEVRVVLSFVPSSSLLAAVAEHRTRPICRELEPLDGWAVDRIVGRFFGQYDKRLRPANIARIRRLPAARDPLYLLVLLEELRKLGFDLNQDPDFLKRMASERPDAKSLFDWVLKRLEDLEGGRDGLPLWCGYLARARTGLSGSELADLLAAKLGSSGALVARRIERSIRAYLMRRGRRLDFYHEQLRLAAEERYRPDDPGQLHQDLADYFGDRWQHDDHALKELPFHLTSARSWEALFQVLGDDAFVSRHLETLEGERLVEDFAFAFDSLVNEDEVLAERLVELLIKHFVRHEFQDTDQASRFTIDRFHSWIGYRAHERLFYKKVLQEGASVDQRAFRLKCRLRLAAHYRRASDRERSEELLAGLANDFLDLGDAKSAGSVEYELGYLNFLGGDFEEAAEWFHLSVEHTKAEDAVRAAISRCLEGRAIFLANRDHHKEFEAILRETSEIFEQFAAVNPNARRWRVFNNAAHLFEIAYHRRDQELGRECLEEMEKDDWALQYENTEIMLTYRARQAYLEGDADLAASYFDEFWLSESSYARESAEAVARHFLDHGRALVVAGREAEALKVWRKGLECEPHNGNRVWQQEIEREWEQATNRPPDGPP